MSETPQGKSVLLVEDNEDNLVIYSTILRHSGYEVLEARDGQAGIELAQREHPALILMDVSIPLVDGWEATRRLKADPQTADIPIIALTANVMARQRADYLAAGMNGVIAKPISPATLLTEIARILAPEDATLAG